MSNRQWSGGYGGYNVIKADLTSTPTNNTNLHLSISPACFLPSTHPQASSGVKRVRQFQKQAQEQLCKAAEKDFSSPPTLPNK